MQSFCRKLPLLAVLQGRWNDRCQSFSGIVPCPFSFRKIVELPFNRRWINIFVFLGMLALVVKDQLPFPLRAAARISGDKLPFETLKRNFAFEFPSHSSKKVSSVLCD